MMRRTLIAALANLMRRGVLCCALGNMSTLGPLADCFARLLAAGETAKRLKEYGEISESKEIHARQIVAMYSVVAPVQHVTMRDLPWRMS
eukprot:s709_g27.t1